MHRLASITSTGLGAVLYTYDTYGKLTKIARGTTEYNLTYDTWNRPIETKVGTTALSTNTYDSYGKLLTVAYANGFSARYEYDNLDRVAKIYQTENNTESLVYEMIYNGEGDLYELRNYRTLRASFFDYDHAGRCMASKERSFTVSGNTIGYGNIISSYEYKYDECNNLTKLTCSVAGSTWSTTYTYDKDNRPKTTTLSSGKVLTNTYDTLGRLASRKIGLSSDYITTLTYVPGNETNKTTGLVGTYQNGSDDAYTYTYDDNGNITAITQGTTSITYEYDTANRLTRENNGLTNETVTYEYDVWGNILNRKVYAYTTGDLTNVPYTEIEYEYTNTAWGDQLTSYDNVSITYDDMGNPLTYRGYTFGWRGKQLVSAGNGTDTVAFEYNEDGLRQKKTVNNVDTDYFYNGSVLIGMQRGTDKLLFSYDASGSVVSVNYNGTEYYYLRNAQGDVVKLIDASGAVMVEYTYDTWGKKVQTTGSLAGTLGTLQPFRYRGYVYDEETGFYYLQSRYYDPTTGRFISADVMLSTGQGVLGHNCYAYCGDNPIMRVDPNGRFWIAVLVGVIAVGLLCTVGCSNQTDNEPTPSPTAEITPYVEEVTLAVEEPTQTILLLTDEEKIFVATVCGEAIGENEMAWKAVAHVIMNRIGYKEWSQCKTATDVITQPSQFNGYQSPQYNYCMDYLNNRDGKNTKYEQVIAAVIPIYLKQEEDFTNKAVLFYSPKSMKNGSVPNWAKKSIVEEVVIGGIDLNSFRFYRYK